MWARRPSIMSGAWSRSFRAYRTISACAEGTPNISSVRLSPGLRDSVIHVGFHYYTDCEMDRQARGRLVDFSSWSARSAPELDAPIEAAGVRGGIGDRDIGFFGGGRYTPTGGQVEQGNWATRRVFLSQRSTPSTLHLQIPTH